MNVLGLDMSSQKSGYALYVDGKLTDFGAWELSSDAEKDWRKRIAYMANHVHEFIMINAVDMVYVEDVPPTIENSQTVKVLSALQGMIIAVCETVGAEVEFVPVKRWKSVIGINLASSAENHACKDKIKKTCGNKAVKCLEKVKRWTKAWEKKLSVDYANHTFGLDLVYKSPTSKFNQDDIADAINVAWSQMGNIEKYDLESFESIMDNFYELATQE